MKFKKNGVLTMNQHLSRTILGLMLGTALLTTSITETNSANQKPEKPTTSQTLPARPAQSDLASRNHRTSGFNYHGHHFRIRKFYGVGYVPGNHFVYKWAGMKHWYLIERTGAAARSIHELHRGSHLIVSHRRFRVTHIFHNFADNDYAYPRVHSYLRHHRKDIGWQECNGRGGFTLWFARHI